MRAKHNKKNSKNKNVENNTTTQYEEKYNDVILNDMVPEDRKEEFSIQENEKHQHKKTKKNGFKFNVGKKANKNNKQEQKKEEINKNKIEKNTEVEEQKKSKKTKPQKYHKKQKSQETNKSKDKAGHKKIKKRVSNHNYTTDNKETNLNVTEAEEIKSEKNIEEIENITYRGDLAEKSFQENMNNESNDISWTDEKFDK